MLAPGIVMAGLLCQSAHAVDFGSGLLPLRYTPDRPIALDGHDELRITGTVEATQPMLVVLRIDDGVSHSYATRYNEERTVPPGPFEWTIPLNGLLTASGRVLDAKDLRRIYLFTGKTAAGRVTVERFASTNAPRLPEGVKGYALGSSEAPLPPGFERIAPGDPRIESGRPVAVRRPAPDPLVANGARGVERLRLPWSGARARVSLWTEDPGEWELLPHPLHRRIRVNGIDVLDERQSASTWIEGRYLRGKDAEHRAGDDAWTAYGRQRGGRVSSVVDVSDGSIVIDLAGDGAAATHLAGVVVEAAESSAGVQHVEDWRANWYRQTWPVVEQGGERSEAALSITLIAGQQTIASLRLTSVAGSGVRFRLSVSSDKAVATPAIELDPPVLGSQAADIRLWAGQWRLERRRANDTTLSFGDNMLVGTTGTLPITPGRPRLYEGWIDVPADAVPGEWRGEIRIGAEHASVRIPVHVDVLAVVLPPAAKPAGFYLDEAPHFTWFAEGPSLRARQTACDLALMRSFGIAGTAPALATPRQVAGAFEQDIAEAMTMGVAQPLLAYAPAKRLAAQSGLDGSADMIARIDAGFEQEGKVPPVWSVADEPSNPAHSTIDLQEWIRTLRAATPRSRLAAHLNAPSDLAFAHLLDVVLVNDGYGLDLPALEAIRSRVGDLWLYNTAHPRTTAGLWLWRSPASRYVQWHGRMPTADPFDPTDGREGDVQMIFPSASPCPRLATVHRDLLDMAEGLVDQRWLLWLARQDAPEARALTEAIRRQSDTWQQARTLGERGLAKVRESIIEIARRRGRG